MGDQGLLERTQPTSLLLAARHFTVEHLADKPPQPGVAGSSGRLSLTECLQQRLVDYVFGTERTRRQLAERFPGAKEGAREVQERAVEGNSILSERPASGDARSTRR
jgi:hypothetical protein